MTSDVNTLIICCIAAVTIKLWHSAANYGEYNKELHTLTAVSPALKCFLLEFVCNALVMNIN